MVVSPSVPSFAVLPAGPLVVPGVPGGPELLVVLLVAIVVFGLPLVLVTSAYLYLKRDMTIEELEARIADLEAEQGVSDADTTADGTAESTDATANEEP